MDNTRDLYPTRTTERIRMFPRLDTVVHTDNDRRWDGPLSEAEVDAFDRNGFLFFPGFFGADEVAEFREELRRLEQEPTLHDWDGMIREPGSEEVRSVFAIHQPSISRQLARLARDRRLLDRVRQLLASDVYVHQSRINYKPGFKGKGFNWHSDFETWHAEDGMPYMRAVSCSIVLTDNHEFNGPLMLVPGSHRWFVPTVGETPEDNYRSSLKDQQVGVPDGDSLAALIREGGIEAAKGPAGSLLMFECNTLHASNANMSPDPRSNVFFVYNSVRNTPSGPFSAPKERPDFLAERSDLAALEPAD